MFRSPLVLITIIISKHYQNRSQQHQPIFIKIKMYPKLILENIQTNFIFLAN
jgi:hypothetical protein